MAQSVRGSTGNGAYFMTGKIFLNYRRADAEAWADRLFERLIMQFPRENVFLDIDGNIPIGFPWAKWLDQQVGQCDLMLVLIGRTWVPEFSARSAPGQRDYVRVEIESALARNIPVVPVFLGDAPVPSPADLPPSIQQLMDLQAVRLQRLNFDADAARLIADIARSIALARGGPVPQPATPQPRPGDIIHDAPFAPRLIVVPAGSFQMGSPEGEGDDDERPQHMVIIAQSFAAGIAPVTRGEFASFIAATGRQMTGAFVWTGNEYKHEPKASWLDPGFKQADDHPVTCVSWEDAQAYIAWLRNETRRDSYRLLTEAEWEYCCRAGSEAAYSTGKSITKEQANFGQAHQGTTPVAKFPANRWGLHDMHGNVWEWCEDAWHGSYRGAPADGSAWLQGGEAGRRVVRGGSWFNNPLNLRSAYRSRSSSDSRDSDLGFRVGRTLSA